MQLWVIYFSKIGIVTHGGGGLIPPHPYMHVWLQAFEFLLCIWESAIVTENYETTLSRSLYEHLHHSRQLYFTACDLGNGDPELAGREGLMGGRQAGQKAIRGMCLWPF